MRTRDFTAALSGSVSGIVERRQSLRGANRRQIVAILRAANPKLREKAAAEAAAMIGHVLKLVPMLAKEQEDGGQPLVAQVRKMLAAYVDRAGGFDEITSVRKASILNMGRVVFDIKANDYRLVAVVQHGSGCSDDPLLSGSHEDYGSISAETI